jgi:hypothetical protein
MSLELYKITIGTKKKFYESTTSFERQWKYHTNTKWCPRYSDVTAYKLVDMEWKQIRKKKATWNRPRKAAKRIHASKIKIPLLKINDHK